MQAARNSIRLLRQFPPCSSPTAALSPSLGLVVAGGRVFSTQSALRSDSTSLDKQEVTDRVLHLLKSSPFVDPSKVHPASDFKNDLQLDMLDNVQVMMAAEEEFAVDIPNSEADKISTAAHLINYIAAHPQAK